MSTFLIIDIAKLGTRRPRQNSWMYDYYVIETMTRRMG